MLLDIILATVAVSLVSLVGILVIFRGNKPIISLKSFISFAAGSLLGVTFLELLPELFETSAFEPRELFLTVLISIAFFFIVERFIHWHHCLCNEKKDDKHCHAHSHTELQKTKKKVLVVNNLIGDAIHNIIDGFLIAAAFMVNRELGITVTIGVIIHEIPQEISDFGVLLYGGFSKAKALMFNLLVGVTAVLGAILFYFFLSDYQWLTPIFVAFAAGNFIYLAMADIIPQIHDVKKTKSFWKHTAWFLIGIFVMWFVLGALPHSHAHEDGHNHGNDIHVEQVMHADDDHGHEEEHANDTDEHHGEGDHDDEHGEDDHGHNDEH